MPAPLIALAAAGGGGAAAGGAAAGASAAAATTATASAGAGSATSLGLSAKASTLSSGITQSAAPKLMSQANLSISSPKMSMASSKMTGSFQNVMKLGQQNMSAPTFKIPDFKGGVNMVKAQISPEAKSGVRENAMNSRAGVLDKMRSFLSDIVEEKKNKPRTQVVEGKKAPGEGGFNEPSLAKGVQEPEKPKKSMDLAMH